MPTKRYNIDTIGDISITKSRRSKHIRLTIKHNGDVHVALPLWAPYKLGIEYAKSRSDWVKTHRVVPQRLQNNTKVGKAHHLLFAPTNASRPTSRIKNSQIIVSYPQQLNSNDDAVQRIAQNACVRALTLEAEQLLLPRLRHFAEQFNFQYATATIKKLKSRWGSCSSKGDIVLNCYLMQLPWREIDYVLLHELTHTQYMSHSLQFWTHLTSCLPDAKQIRKEIGKRKPYITTQ